MPIFEKDDARALFVHIPRTGGTAIERWLRQNTDMIFFHPHPPSALRVTPQHIPIGDLKILFGHNWWKWAFAIVRDPYDRIESEYFYRLHHQRYLPNFSRWVVQSLDRLKKEPFYLDNHLMPQTELIDSSVTLYRFEDGLQQVADDLAGYFAIQLHQLSRVNASMRKQVAWSSGARHRFNAYYAKDFAQLKYKLIDT